VREVTILGSGPTHSLCKYDTEIWGVNHVSKWDMKLDKLFFFDDHDIFTTTTLTLADVARCYKRGVEIVTTQKNADHVEKVGIKCVIYPIDEIIEEFNTAYFANSISYMIAYAMHQKMDMIKMYGVDEFDIKYVYERCCVEYWLGRAKERGIELELSKGTAVLKTLDGKLYGYNKFIGKAWA
jgi:hypothetical protein